MLSLYWFLAFVSGVLGLVIVKPTAGTPIDVSKQFNITWISEVSDPKSISIKIVSSGATRNRIVYTIVQGYDTSIGRYEGVWPHFVATPSLSYQFRVSDSETDNVIAQTDAFNFTIQLQVRGDDGFQGKPPDPSEETAKNINPGDGSAHDKIVVETVVPLVIVVAVICFGITGLAGVFRRRRTAQEAKEKMSADIEEARLVDEQSGTRDVDLDVVRPKRSSFTIVMPKESRKSHIKWDLPETPRLSSESHLADLSNGGSILKLFPGSHSASASTSTIESHDSQIPLLANSTHSSHPSHPIPSPDLSQLPRHFPPAHFLSSDSRTLTEDSTITLPTIKSTESQSTTTTRPSTYHALNAVETKYPVVSGAESPVSEMSPLTSRDVTSPIARSRLSAVLHDMIHEELSRVSRR